MITVAWIAIVSYATAYVIVLRHVGSRIDRHGRSRDMAASDMSRVELTRIEARLDALGRRVDALDVRLSTHADRHVG